MIHYDTAMNGLQRHPGSIFALMAHSFLTMKPGNVFESRSLALIALEFAQIVALISCWKKSSEINNYCSINSRSPLYT